MYKTIDQADIQYLKSFLPEERICVGSEILSDYYHDELSGTENPPEVLVFALTTEEVSKVLAYANEKHIPVTTRGAGTGLVGSSVAVHGGIMLCTSKMDKILELDEKNLTVTVQPGVLLMTLAAYCEEHHFFYPPDPGEKMGSVGGNVSTNAGGMRAVKYGTTRDYVLAMTAVLPNGEIIEVGRAVAKTSSGYSLLHLIIGSEGTLAVITELTMKLIPNPPENTSFIIPFANIDDAISTVPAIKLAGLDPQAIEFMERDIVDASAAHTGKSVFPTSIDGQEAGAYILVTFDGTDSDEIYQRAEKLYELVLEHGAYEALVVDTPSEKEAVWAARSAFLTVIEHDSEMLDEMDVVVPTDKIPEFLHYIYGVGADLGVRIRSFGHAGDGNLHIYCAGEGMPEADFLALTAKVMEAAYAKCAELGGQVSGEHGIGHAKKEYLRESVGDTAMGLMSGIKAVFDPKGLLNPGKICSDL